MFVQVQADHQFFISIHRVSFSILNKNIINGHVLSVNNRFNFFILMPEGKPVFGRKVAQMQGIKSKYLDR